MWLFSNVSASSTDDLISTVFTFDLIPYTVIFLKSRNLRVVLDALWTVTNLMCSFEDPKYKERLLAYDNYGIVEAIMPLIDSNYFDEPESEDDRKREVIDLMSDTIRYIDGFVDNLVSDTDEAPDVRDAKKYCTPVKLVHDALQSNTDERFDYHRDRFASLSGVIASLLETEANVKNSPETEADDVTTGSAVNISDSNGDDVAGCSSKAGDDVDMSVDAACDISQHVPSRSMENSSSVSFSTSQSQTNPSIFFPSL